MTVWLVRAGRHGEVDRLAVEQRLCVVGRPNHVGHASRCCTEPRL